jgi:hypothetical protein
MASKFLEASGDQTFSNNDFWLNGFGAPAVATDFVHGGHVKSIKYRPNTADANAARGTMADAGGRYSVWIYLVALPSATSTLISLDNATQTTDIVRIRITTGGVLQLFDGSTQLGSNGATLSTGQWYRISSAYVITSTTVNDIKLWVGGASSITVHNVTIGATGTSGFNIGNYSSNLTLDMRSSDHYIDNSSALTDPGNIWLTAKRTFSNGTTNGYTTQVGSGGSGYGTGHAPQVNERPGSDTNGWSMIGAGSAITEEYNIESVSQGDIDITGATIVDYTGWVRSKALASETASIIVNNVTSNIALTSTTTIFTKIAGSSSYPAGTGTDIGEVTSTALTTVSLFEAGIIVAYIPAVVINKNVSFKTLLGVGQI